MSRASVSGAWWIMLQWVITGAAAAASAQPATSTSRPPAAVVTDLYASFERGDLSHVLTLLSPDVVWTFHGPDSVIPYAGVYKGRDGVAEFFTNVAATIKVRKIAERRFITDGDHVVVIGSEESTALNTGGLFVANWTHLFTVKKGQISAFEEFTDTAAIANALAAADPARGKAYFTTCAGCHGRAAEGNHYMHAPNLTIQGSTYLLAQLRDFRNGTRGGPQDFYGWQMNGRAKALPDDRAMRDVVAYIATLPTAHATATFHVRSDAGRASYGTCAGCHGLRGQGGAQSGAPALAGLDDWYVIEQLDAFRRGRRGTDGGSAAAMRAAALGLRSEEAVRSVAAYIATFQ